MVARSSKTTVCLCVNDTIIDDTTLYVPIASNQFLEDAFPRWVINTTPSISVARIVPVN
jgi:hypothetical protein